MEYEYIGYNADRRVVKGRIAADNEKTAGDKLTQSGYQILSLKPLSAFFTTNIVLRSSVKQEEIVMFSRQLALLLESGIGIVQGLELLKAQTTNKGFAKLLDVIVNDLRAGSPLSAAMEKHPAGFSKMYCKIIAVGEQTGQLEGVLRNLADYTEQATAAMRKVRQAMTYPIIVFLLAIGVGIVTVTFVLPPIMNLFKSFGSNLPLVTQVLIWFLDIMTNYGAYIGVTILVLIVIAFFYVRTPNGGYQKDLLMLRLPVFGRLNLVNSLSRICRSIAMLFRSGLPLPDILTLTAESSGNRVLSRALLEVEQDIIRGDSLAASMKKKPVFLPLMTEMTRVGEETGNLDSTLTIVSDSFEIEAADKLQTLLGMIEPAMTIAIGLVVGFLALAIFVPIYSSLSLVGK